MQEQDSEQQADKNVKVEAGHPAAQFIEQFNRIQHPIGKEEVLPVPNFSLVRQ